MVPKTGRFHSIAFENMMSGFKIAIQCLRSIKRSVERSRSVVLSGHSSGVRGFCLLACNILVFSLMAAYSFLRFRKATPPEGEDEDDEKEASTTAAQSFKTVEVDGREVTLRVFTPAGGGGSKPAVVMVCGLLWRGFGEGILGFIGLNFNDAFGHALARNGLPCVQIHTPQRHIAHTRVQELALALCAPVYLVPGLRFLLLAGSLASVQNARISKGVRGLLEG
eukprot:s264_g6.t1